MTAFTSIGGMLPLVVLPGAGSELYRGLGSVVVGGLPVSTVFTIFLVPAMLSLAADLREAVIGLFRPTVAPEPVRPAAGVMPAGTSPTVQPMAKHA